MWKECNMPFLFKLAQRVARLRSRLLLVTAAAVAGACARELAAPASGKPPVTLQISAADATPGGSVAVVLRAAEPLAAIQETVSFDPQRLRYERPGDGPDLVVVNDQAAAQASLRILATTPQGLAPTGVTLVFTVTASGYTEGVRGTLELAVAPDNSLVWGTVPAAPSRAAGTSPSGGYRFGEATLDGLINVFDVLLLNNVSTGAATLAPQAFLLANVRPVNGGATATGVPPTCDPTTTCRPVGTPADAQSPNGSVDATDAAAVASVVVGVSVPVVGQLAPASGTPDTTVASVTISPATGSIRVAQTLQLTATPKDLAGGTLTGRTMTWTSGNTSVATISGSGLVAGVTAGSATITATSEGKSSTAALTVTTVPVASVASVAVAPATASLTVGQTMQLTATPKDSAGGTLTGRTVMWSSSNPSVATVSGSGLVTSVVVGTATITATSEGKAGSATVTVTLVPVASVASVAVSPATASIRVGQTVQLTATPKDSAGSALPGRTVTWGSSNTAVATVSPSGLVTSKAAGSATITATSEGKASSAAVTVTLVPVASVVVSPAPATVPAKGTVQLSVTLKDANGNTLTLSGRTVAWTSSAPTIATVSPSGLVTDMADGGTATITATSEGQSGASVVTVQAPVASGSVPDPTLLPVASGQAPNLSAYLALNVANQPAGFSYNDPVTRVKVWKVTSSSTPSANSGAGHDYSDGPNEVSLGWGTNNNTHTILIRGDGMAYYLVDFTRGAGFSNYRRLTVQPARDLCFTFSNLASQPRIAYILTGSQVVRFNTATMQTENTGNFPLNQAA